MINLKFIRSVMKPLIRLSIVALLVTLSVLPATAQVFQSFSVKSESGNVAIEWTSGSERSVLEYRIQRSFDGREFHDILSKIEPVGDNHSYRVMDTDLFKESLTSYYYRVEAVLVGGRSQTSVVREISLSFSNVRRTWGSLKAMFR